MEEVTPTYNFIDLKTLPGGEMWVQSMPENLRELGEVSLLKGNFVLSPNEKQLLQGSFQLHLQEDWKIFRKQLLVNDLEISVELLFAQGKTSGLT